MAGSKKEAILALLKGAIKAIEDGEVAVEQLEGKTLAEMAEISEAGWDRFDAVIAEGRAAGHDET